jgi:HAD superfamily hydrolase (TIGR01549 family)
VPLKAVFLDSGGVITKLEAARHKIFARAAREVGRPVPEAAAKAAFDAVARFEAENGSLMLDDVYAFDRMVQEVTFREAGLGPPDGRIQDRYEAIAQKKEYRSMYPDVVPTLEELRRSGYLVGLISNAHPDLRKLLTLFDLLAYFDAPIISGEVGLMKPDPKIFRRGLESLGVGPAEAVHVGDDPVVDYEGARRAGLQAILVDRQGRYRGGNYRQIPDLFSLSDALEASGGRP